MDSTKSVLTPFPEHPGAITVPALMVANTHCDRATTVPPGDTGSIRKDPIKRGNLKYHSHPQV